MLEDAVEVRCPWCFEHQELWIDPATRGEMVQDCDVCCRPWRVVVARGDQGELQVWIDRA